MYKYMTPLSKNLTYETANSRVLIVLQPVKGIRFIRQIKVSIKHYTL